MIENICRLKNVYCRTHGGWFMVFNATFNNISVISWQQDLEEYLGKFRYITKKYVSKKLFYFL
jgi:hypothetical protein